MQATLLFALNKFIVALRLKNDYFNGVWGAVKLT
jgi:hypothetical protein